MSNRSITEKGARAADGFNWDDLRIFLAVFRDGSHAAAARSLRVDPTTVGRRIAALEEAVGVRLFRRTRSGLVATDDGEHLAKHATTIETAVVTSQRELRSTGSSVVGRVRVTASDGSSPTTRCSIERPTWNGC